MDGISGRSAANTCCDPVTHSRSTIHRLLDEYGLAARRELGQNFVADPNTVRRIAALSGVGVDDVVVEIGPGLGSLTLALIETGADVRAIEIDHGLAAAVAEIVGDRATIIEADAQRLDWSALLADTDRPAHVVSNLPYNVGTTMIIDILATVPQVGSMLVLVQSEVAQRLAAAAGSPEYGIPSVLVARHAVARIVGHVPPTVFVPRPKVESSLVRLVRHTDVPSSVGHEDLAVVVKAGFGQRRKMLRRSLRGLATEEQLIAAGIDPTSRAEDVNLDLWCRLAEIVAATSGDDDGFAGDR